MFWHSLCVPFVSSMLFETMCSYSFFLKMKKKESSFETFTFKALKRVAYCKKVLWYSNPTAEVQQDCRHDSAWDET